MSRRFPQLFWGLLTLALALVAAAALGADAVRDARRGGDQLEVTGSARRPIRSDFVVWRLSVSSQAPTLQEASGALRGDAGRVRAWLRASGLADSVVTVRPLETVRMNRLLENGMETGELVGYRLTQTFEVRSPDVQGITVLTQRAGELIDQGVPLMAAPPEYLFTRLPEIRTQMLAEATKDARERAAAIAESAGSRIGAVRSARMGVFQITPRNSTEVSDYGINDTSSLEKDITAVVRVTFSLE